MERSQENEYDRMNALRNQREEDDARKQREEEEFNKKKNFHDELEKQVNEKMKKKPSGYAGKSENCKVRVCRLKI